MFKKAILLLALTTVTAMGFSPIAVTASDAAVINKGTKLEAKLLDKLSSSSSQIGQTFRAALVPGLFRNRQVKGYFLTGHVDSVTSSKAGGKKGNLVLVFDSLVAPNGQTRPVQVRIVERVKAQGTKLRTLGLIVGGAMAGHVAGNKLDKKHGGLMGAAAGAAAAFTMPGGEVVLDKGEKLDVKFEQTVPLLAAPGAQKLLK
jgi:hypothetical protein